MGTLNRRRFSLLGVSGLATAALVACGNEVGNEEALNPTKIPDVAGAPPTLAPNATPGGSAPEAPAGGGETAGGGEAGGPITLEAHDPYNWSANELSAAPGQTIHVVSAANLPHDFAIDEFGGVLIDLPKMGAEGDWVVPADTEVGATFQYYCNIPGHRQAGMEGTLTIVAAGAAGGGEEASPEEASPAAEGGGAAPSGPVTLEAHDPYNWSTNELTASPGQTIHVVSAAILPHDFAIDEFGGVLIDLPKMGAEDDWVVPADAAPGDYQYYCTIPGHRQAGMEGTLHIVAAGAAPAASGGASTPAEQSPAAGGGGAAAALTLEAHDPYNWSTSTLAGKAGDVITVTNTGFLPHDFAIDEFGGVLVDLPSNGATEDWTIPADAAPGDYTYYCNIPGHRQAGMEGTLTIS
jgi:uncharacterized cupredoxin-like copper-binding protein